MIEQILRRNDLFRSLSSFEVGMVLRILFVLVAVMIGGGFVAAQDARTVAKQVFPSVVLLEMLNAEGKPISRGSGFFVRPDIVVTNYHVIDKASSGYLKIVGQSKIQRIEGAIAIDVDRDLALLKIETGIGKPLRLADIGKLEVGETVFAVGNPKGLEGTISPGIVSGINLRIVGKESLIQITAPISAGSSGGPVVNKLGEVVGVASLSIKSGQNLNFAIPSTYVALLLAGKKELVPLATVNRTGGIVDDGLTLTETTNWITQTLEGSEYPSIGAAGVGRIRLEKVRFYGCIMEVRRILTVPGFGSVASVVEFPLTIVSRVGPLPPEDGKTHLGFLFVRDVAENFYTPNNELLKTGLLENRAWKLEVRNAEIGWKLANAFAQASFKARRIYGTCK